MALANRERKRQQKVFNERLKLVVSYVHALAPALLGFGVLRYVLDPIDLSNETLRYVAITAARLGTEGLAVYFLRYLRSED